MSNTQRVEGHTPTLESCPFCDKAPHWHEDQGVACINRKCIIFGIIFTDEAKWNRRSSIERLEKVNEALVRALQDLMGPADGCVGVLWKSCDPRDGKHYADQTNKAIESARAVLRLAKEPA